MKKAQMDRLQFHPIDAFGILSRLVPFPLDQVSRIQGCPPSLERAVCAKGLCFFRQVKKFAPAKIGDVCPPQKMILEHPSSRRGGEKEVVWTSTTGLSERAAADACVISPRGWCLRWRS